MTTKDLRNSVEKVLGNNIRCLLPSYWWKRLFHQVADTIDEVNGVDIVSSESALNRLDAPIGSLASIANKKTMKPSECYVPTDEDSNLTDEELVAKLTRLTGLEVSFPLPDITGVEATAVLVGEDAGGEGAGLGFLVISEGFCAAMFVKSTSEGGQKEFLLTSQSSVNSLNTFLKQHKIYWVGLDFDPEDTEEYIKETTELYDRIFTIVDCTSDVYVKGMAWERLVKEGEGGSASASVPSYTLYYTTYKVNGVTTMADKYINLNKEEYAKIIASQKAKENYLLQVVEIGTGEEYAPVDVELSWFSIADLNDTDGNFNVTVCSFLQRNGANQPQRRLVSFKSDGTAEYELIPTGDVKFLYYADGANSLSAKEKAHNASAILPIRNSFDSSFTPSPIIIRYKIDSTKYLSLQGILSGNDAEGDGVTLTAFASPNLYYRFNYDLATGEPAKAEPIQIGGGEGSYDDTEIKGKLAELSERTLYENPLNGVTFGDSERDLVLKKVLKYIWLEVLDSSFELPKQWNFYLLRNSVAKSPQFLVQLCLADSDDVVFTYSYATKVTGYAEFICNGFSTHKNKVNLHFGVDFSDFIDDINYATSFGTYIKTDEVNRYEVKEDEFLNVSVRRIEEKVAENSSVAQYVQDQDLVTRANGVNLYDNRVEPMQDTLVNQNGLISSVGYNTSFPLFLKAGKYAVTHNHSSLGANAFFAEVDANGNVISVFKGLLAENNAILKVDIKNGYYRFNIGNSNQLATFMITKDGEYPSEYVPFQSYINNAFVRYQDIIGIPADNPSSNSLNGKIISFNGDSICAGSGGYGKIIAERNEMVYENIAVSGGTIAAETYSNEIARHWISRTISNMREDADFAIVEGGVNDSSLAVPLGSMSNGYDAALDDTTFYGAFESMLKQLLLRFQGKKVGYIFVHQMTNNFRHSNEKEGSYYWAARLCCEKWGVPFCDLNVSVPAFGLFKSSSDMYVLTQQYTKNSDGWHPNEEGYKKYYCDKIEAWLKTL